jgi:site-specific DNA-methyltransferase (adenine-specific)
MTTPAFYADDTVTLYHGDCRELLPTLSQRFNCAIADSPYEETALPWDRWPDGWPATVAQVTNSMWSFGSMRVFIDRQAEFAAWRMSQDIIWEKHNGSGFATDRFRRVHEHAVHWYTGSWNALHHQVPRVPHAGPDRGTRRAARAGSAHLGENNGHDRPWLDDGTRLLSSVMRVRSMHGRALHPTEKPVELLVPLITYACPPNGIVLDPFAGSGSTAVAARLCGRRAVLIEADERYCQTIATRLAQDVLPIGGAA